MEPQPQSSSRKRKQSQPRKLAAEEKQEKTWDQLPNELPQAIEVIDLNKDDTGDSIIIDGSSDDQDYAPERKGPQVRKYVTIDGITATTLFLFYTEDDDDDFYGPAPAPKKARRKSFPASPAKNTQPILSDSNKNKREIQLGSSSVKPNFSKGKQKHQNLQILLEISNKDKLSASVNLEGEMIIFSNEEPIGISQFPGNEEELKSFISLSKKNIISFSVSQVEGEENIMLHFYLTDIAFPWRTVSNDRRETSQEKNMKLFILWLLPHLKEKLPIIANGTKKSNFEFNIKEIYDEIKPSKTSASCDQPKDLIPTLRPYQKRAVGWMIKRENSLNSNSDELHPLWIEIKAEDGKIFYMNPYTGLLSRDRFSDQTNVSGGILSDEMGLGKTLEILSLILLHKSEISTTSSSESDSDDESISCVCGMNNSEPSIQCKTCHVWQHTRCVLPEDDSEDDSDPDDKPKRNKHNNQTFYCERCISFNSKEDVESGGTLIICPQSILIQWKKEIEKHVKKGKLQVFLYEGVKKGLILPSKLAFNDIVLTTFEVLREDLYHYDVGYNRNLRNEKKYKLIPTPLSSVKWWRIVIDECQMVESSTAKASEMALRLDTVHRWCVSGTPIQRNLDDLFGLVMFLKLSPYDEQIWWNRVLQRPFETGTKEGKSYLLNFLRKFLWRSSKKDVSDELHIPPQSERVIELHFSPVESYFYKKQFSECQHDFSLLAKKKKGRILSNQEFVKLMNPLLRLRQACCHPQVGSKAIRSLQKNTMSMAELLDQLIAKAHVECEETLRALLLSINGLAGTFILQNKKEEAVTAYCQALETIYKNMDLEPDKLQWIHALYNLQDVMKELKMTEVKVNGNKMTLESLSQLEEKNKDFFTKEFLTRVEVFAMQLKEKEKKATVKNSLNWYAAMFAVLEENSLVKQFMKSVKETLATIQNEEMSKVIGGRRSKFIEIREFAGLKLALFREIEAQENARKEAIQAVKSLHKEPSSEDLSKLNECGCWSSLSHRKRICNFCGAENLIDTYEKLLYWSSETSHVGYQPMGEDMDEGDLQHGRVSERVLKLSEHPSEVEVILKTLQKFISNSAIQESASVYFGNLEARKLEFKTLKKLWRAEKDYLGNVDELSMSRIRIQFRTPEEEKVNEIEKNYKILPYELEHKQRKFITDKGISEINLRQAQSQLQYLKTLQKDKSEAEKEICPVCTEPVGPQRVILVCGHTFCEECIVAIIKRSKGMTIKCPTCRAIVNVNEISYIMDSLADENKADLTRKMHELYPVKGSYGTKVEGIIRQLLILNEKEKSKSLVFSEWADVLEIISRGLSENGISHTSFKSKKGFQKAIEEFKSNPEVRVLLLPIKNGANGLNITEATNVLLVEPMLNLGSEAQAINRVHRIGQEKETVVFRFVIKNTIEERILDMNKNKTTEWKSNKEIITVEDLESLFTNRIEDLSMSDSQVSPMEEETTELQNIPSLFWNAKVLYHNTSITRLQALGQLELVFSWECKEHEKNISTEPKTVFMGRAIYEEVCRRLLDIEVEGIESTSVSTAIEEMRSLLSKNGKQEI